jgi:hypothetical protein
MKLYLLLPLYILILTGCAKKATPETAAAMPERFAFGTAYGECGGNCATFYLLNDGKIYLDDMEYFTGPLSFANIALDDEKYRKAKQLAINIPSYLLNNPTFGCPDCHDQGLVYIEYKRDGKLMYWKIDNDTDKQPQEIRSYISQLKDVMQQIK